LPTVIDDVEVTLNAVDGSIDIEEQLDCEKKIHREQADRIDGVTLLGILTEHPRTIDNARPPGFMSERVQQVGRRTDSSSQISHQSQGSLGPLPSFLAAEQGWLTVQLLPKKAS
jgi:hypothetical protein